MDYKLQCIDCVKDTVNDIHHVTQLRFKTTYRIVVASYSRLCTVSHHFLFGLVLLIESFETSTHTNEETQRIFFW